MDLSYFHQLIQHITDYLRIYPHTGYAITFFIAFAESLAIIGSIIPGSVIMTTIGMLIGSGVLPFTPTFICAIAGSFAGDLLSYWIGNRYNDRLLKIWPFRNHPHWLTIGENFFKKHGGKSIILGRFFGPIRSAIPLIAGMLKMNTTRFMMATVPAVIMWATLYTVPGILIGAFALELPKSTATKFILLILATIAFGWFIFVAIHIVFKRFSQFMDRMMQKTWLYMSSSRPWSGMTNFLSFPGQINPQKQLTRINCILLCLIFFTALFLSVYFQTRIILINDALFFFFRSLRNHLTDPAMIAFTLLGEKAVLISASILIAIWLVWYRALKAAFIYVSIVLISAGSIGVLKYIYYSPRPDGLLQASSSSSFPSGHTILAVACFGFLAFLIAERTRPISRRIIYSIAITFIALVAFSRLYLSAHWFTDVLAAIMLGLVFVLSAIVIYCRRPTKIYVVPKYLGIVSIGIFLLVDFGYSVTHFREAQHDYTLYWPTVTLEEKKWWEGEVNENSVPLFVASRFGHVKKILNVQWLGDIDQITYHLTKQGWTSYPVNLLDLKKALKKLSPSEGNIHLPLLPIHYQDKHPVRIFTYIDSQHQQITLIVWESRILPGNNRQPFWLGSVFYDMTKKELRKMPEENVDVLYDEAIKRLTSSIDNVYETKIKHLPQDKWPLIMHNIEWNGNILLIREKQ